MRSASALGSCLALAALTFSNGAFAAEEPPERSKAECETATYTAFRPVPDGCLEPIDTDRPHKTDTPHTVPAGHAQVEVGIAEYEIERWRGASSNALTLGNNIYKLGLADRLGPVRHWDVEVLHAAGAYHLRRRRFEASSDLMLRSKVGLIDGPWTLTLVPAVIVPVAPGAVAEAGGYVFFGAELPLDLDLELNVGAMSERGENGAGRAASAVVTGAVTRRLFGPASVFVELYNDTSTRAPERWNTTFDSGVLVRLGRNWQLDAGAYLGVQGAVAAATPFLGLSTRL